MQDLRDLEKFEIEIIELLNSTKILEQMYFGGGTMLRLCHNLNRYSTDLDFWLNEKSNPQSFFTNLNSVLSNHYTILDSANKNFTLIFQIKSPGVKRSLKIEIRKDQTDFDWEKKIAFSKLTNKQVLVKGLTLNQMMTNKIAAINSRGIIRDAFDIQFLVMRGIPLPNDKIVLKMLRNKINKFKLRDYKVLLGSILEKQEREFYIENKFNFLIEEINKQLNVLKM